MGRRERKVKSARRMATVMATITMKHFERGNVASRLAFEGLFRAELRAALCRAGWPWPVADEAARVVVQEALRLARAERPSWAEGQHGYAGNIVKDSVCRNCGTGLLAMQVHYCSHRCARAWHRAFNAEAA